MNFNDMLPTNWTCSSCGKQNIGDITCAGCNQVDLERLRIYEEIEKQQKKDQQKNEREWTERQNKRKRCLTHCSDCDTRSNFFHYIWNRKTKELTKSYSDASNLSDEWVFCNQNCFDSWKGDWFKRYECSYQDYYEESKTKTFTCKWCENKFQVEREYSRGKEITKKYDFCTQGCLDNQNEVISSWNELVLERKNLKVPNFPTMAELEQKKKEGKLEIFVQQKLVEIRQIRSNKSNDNNPTNQQREREREQNQTEWQQLQTEITNLENKPDKTPEEEEELGNLKNKLKDLDKKQESSPTSYLPWIIGGSCLVGVLVLVVFILARQKRKH